MWLRFTAVSLLIVTNLGCGEDGGSPDFNFDPVPADAGSSDAPPPPSSRYGTVIASIPPVTFGGPPFCTYTMNFRQVAIEIVVHDDTEEVTTASVQSLAVEDVVAPCRFAPAVPYGLYYSLGTQTRTANGVTLRLAPGPDNVTAATLVVDLTRGGTGYSAKLTWHRTDQPAPLDWTITTNAPLIRRL